ncbi:Fis family transcriptional regulator [Alteromonadaceae bacterium BrNp21-10]|nr:Fis family transcriptional regulator [Alteromonadaceae bacterium BrNp21-10]
MKKTIKKLDNNVVKALTIACETAKDKVVGFEWLTHTADFSNFPNSLMVTCIFDTDSHRQLAVENEHDIYLRKLIQGQLLKVGIVLKDPRRNVFFDSEDKCHAEHGGDWQRRLEVKH